MNLYTSVCGMVQVEITSADPTALLQRITEQGIPIYSCTPSGDLSVCLILRRRDYRALKKLCQRRGDLLKIQSRRGLYWLGKGFLTRPVLLVGALLYLLLALHLPSRIFFVEVEGNNAIPTRLILDAAQQCGIGFGASRRNVRSEKMKNALLEAVPELQWAGVNTYGCVARISVREGSYQEAEPKLTGFGHIVALRDGFITSCTATQGNLLCAPGQVVSAGDILISGYTDCGLTIRAEQAQGEVYARTNRELHALSPLSAREKGEKNEETKKISLLIGKKRINFGKDSGIWDTTCDRMYEEYYITLPGGFRLPCAVVVERFVSREIQEQEVDQERVQETLRAFGERYLKQQMLAGTISDAHLTFAQLDGYLILAGEYDCIEMIGKMQRQQIGETNE